MIFKAVPSSPSTFRGREIPKSHSMAITHRRPGREYIHSSVTWDIVGMSWWAMTSVRGCHTPTHTNTLTSCEAWCCWMGIAPALRYSLRSHLGRRTGGTGIFSSIRLPIFPRLSSKDASAF